MYSESPPCTCLHHHADSKPIGNSHHQRRVQGIACVHWQVSHLWVFLHSFSDPRLCSVQELSAPAACCLWFPGSVMCPHEMLSVQQSWATVAVLSGSQLSVFWFLCRSSPDAHQSLSDSDFWSKCSIYISFSLSLSLPTPSHSLSPSPLIPAPFFVWLVFSVPLVLAQLPGLCVTLLSPVF